MRIAVVTPYWRETDSVLARCLESVAQQSHPASHVLISDGCPNPLADLYPQVTHLKLARSHGDNGDTPRGIGAKWALDSGFEAVAFLDADNWFAPSHLADLVELHCRTAAEVLLSKRSFHRTDGSEILGLSEAGDGIHFADTSCLLLTGRALAIAPLWANIPAPLAPIADRIFWQMLMAHGFKTAQSERRTLAFTTQYAAHFLAIGETPPAGAKDGSQSQLAADWWNRLPAAEQKRLNRLMGFP